MTCERRLPISHASSRQRKKGAVSPTGWIMGRGVIERVRGGKRCSDLRSSCRLRTGKTPKACGIVCRTRRGRGVRCERAIPPPARPPLFCRACLPFCPTPTPSPRRSTHGISPRSAYTPLPHRAMVRSREPFSQQTLPKTV